MSAANTTTATTTAAATTGNTAAATTNSAVGRQLFIGNLPFIVGWQDLKDLFRSAGTVLRADVALTPQGRSRGFGTVLFSSQEDAQNAIESFNGYEWHGRKVEVRMDKNVRENGGYHQQGGHREFNGGYNRRDRDYEGHHQERPHKTVVKSEGDDTPREQYINPIDPATITTRNLYVGNLPWSVGWQDLKDLFRQAGQVVRSDIPLDYHGRSKGFGTVAMATVEDARKAVEMFNGFDWNGRKIEVRDDRNANAGPHQGNGERGVPTAPVGNGVNAGTASSASSGAPIEEGPRAGRTLFVGNLPFTIQWQELKDLFRQCGTVIRADVAMDAHNRSRGYGTVVMATLEDAAKALQELNGVQVQGRNVEVREDKFAGEGGDGGCQVFVGNLPFSTRWQDLKDLFRPYGLTPAHADILMENQSGRSKGCGIVKFATKEDAERAVKEVNGLNVLGRNIVVKIDKFAAAA